MAKLTDNSKQKMDDIKKALMNAMSEILVTEVASVKANTPVKTGNLRRSITSTEPELENNIVSGKVGTMVIYSAKVEFENKSYLRATLKADTKEIEATLIKHLGGVN